MLSSYRRRGDGGGERGKLPLFLRRVGLNEGKCVLKRVVLAC